MNIQEAFNGFAQDYDKTRRQFIPCFDDFYGATIRLIPFSSTDSFEILDLGAGTGLLSQFILTAYPKAKICLVDIAEKMLLEAKKRFNSFGEQITYRTFDYTQNSLVDQPDSYDLIVSALSIHHLTASEKQSLFKHIFFALKSHGVFINADLCAGETPEIENRYQEDWLDTIRRSGLSEAEINAGLERSKFDKKDTLAVQLSWLKQNNFKDVNCWYSNFSFSVYSGHK